MTLEVRRAYLHVWKEQGVLGDGILEFGDDLLCRQRQDAAAIMAD